MFTLCIISNLAYVSDFVRSFKTVSIYMRHVNTGSMHYRNVCKNSIRACNYARELRNSIVNPSYLNLWITNVDPLLYRLCRTLRMRLKLLQWNDCRTLCVSPHVCQSSQTNPFSCLFACSMGRGGVDRRDVASRDKLFHLPCSLFLTTHSHTRKEWDPTCLFCLCLRNNFNYSRSVVPSRQSEPKVAV